MIHVCGISIALLFYTPLTAAVCKDNDDRCDYWKKLGHCDLNPTFMVDTCPLSCLNPCVCPDQVATLDTACDCVVKAKNGECEVDANIRTTDCISTCQLRLSIFCPTLPAPGDPNAHLSTDGTAYLTQVDEVCNTGFKSVIAANKGRKMCGNNTEWIADPFYDSNVSCQRVDCGTPTDIEQGKRTYTSTLFEATVNYTCNEGYNRTSGDSIHHCTAGGVWVGTVPNCELITCLWPDVALFAASWGPRNTYDSVFRYMCIIGYELISGDVVRRCQQNGQWSGTAPVCSIIHCDPPSIVLHSFVSYTGTSYLSQATYHCLRGYNMTSGDRQRYCTRNREWSGTEPTCTIVTCGEPPLVAGAKSNYTGQNYGDIVTYECYLQEDPDNVVGWTHICNENGVWIGQEGKCSAVRKKFEATPVEAKGSLAVGTAAMSILIVIMVCIVILDIPTVIQQSTYLKKNIKDFQICVQTKARGWFSRNRKTRNDSLTVNIMPREASTISSRSFQTLDNIEIESIDEAMSVPPASTRYSGPDSAYSGDTMTSRPRSFSLPERDLSNVSRQSKTSDVVRTSSPVGARDDRARRVSSSVFINPLWDNILEDETSDGKLFETTHQNIPGSSGMIVEADIEIQDAES